MTTHKLFIGNIPYDTQNADLLNYVSKFGPIIDSSIVFDSITHKSRGFAYVQFKNEADKEIFLHKKHFFNGRKLNIELAPKIKENKSIFIRNIPNHVLNDEIKTIFSKFGQIIRFSRNLKGIVFITFERIENAIAAVCGHVKIEGREVLVEFLKLHESLNDNDNKEEEGLNDLKYRRNPDLNRVLDTRRRFNYDNQEKNRSFDVKKGIYKEYKDFRPRNNYNFGRDNRSDFSRRNNKICVFGIRSTVFNKDLHDYFSRFGRIVELKTVKNKKMNDSHIGFIVFEDWRSAEEAFRNRNHYLKDCQLKVQFAKERNQNLRSNFRNENRSYPSFDSRRKSFDYDKRDRNDFNAFQRQKRDNRHFDRFNEQRRNNRFKPLNNRFSSKLSDSNRPMHQLPPRENSFYHQKRPFQNQKYNNRNIKPYSDSNFYHQHLNDNPFNNNNNYNSNQRPKTSFDKPKNREKYNSFETNYLAKPQYNDFKSAGNYTPVNSKTYNNLKSSLSQRKNNNLPSNYDKGRFQPF